MKKVCSKIIVIVIIVFMVFPLLSCTRNNQKLRIATKGFTEQYILGEMLAVLIENKTNLKVELTKGVITNLNTALINDEFDLYPEYTGTAWNYIMKRTDYPDEATIYAEILKTYKDDYKLDWVGLYGFNNAYGLAVTKELAQKYHIETYSDLAPYADKLIFGTEGDFYEREDGFNGLCAAYGFRFSQKVDLNSGIKYQAVETGKVDVIVVYTTDAQLTNSNVVILRDDKHYFKNYFCGTVIRSDVLKKYPQLKNALLLMNGLINDSEMSKLNYEIEVNKRNEREVITEFLKAKNILK